MELTELRLHLVAKSSSYRIQNDILQEKTPCNIVPDSWHNPLRVVEPLVYFDACQADTMLYVQIQILTINKYDILLRDSDILLLLVATPPSVSSEQLGNRSLREKSLFPL